MRFLKAALYLVLVLVLQTVILPHFVFMGVVPDLVLVSVVIFAVLMENTSAVVHSAVLSFFQDLLSVKAYFNTLIKVIICSVVSSLNKEIMGDKYSRAAAMVAIFSPLSLFAEGFIFYFLFNKTFSFSYFSFRVVAETIYNLAAMPLLYYAIKGIFGGD